MGKLTPKELAIMTDKAIKNRRYLKRYLARRGQYDVKRHIIDTMNDIRAYHERMKHYK